MERFRLPFRRKDHSVDCACLLFATFLLVGSGTLLYEGVTRLLLEDYECEMTWMYMKPKYIEIELPAEIKQQFPKFQLFVYGEGFYAEKLRRKKYNGIPVIYIPGNGGSYKQVRSAASVALLMHPKEYSVNREFNFFAVSFDEELSGIYGGLLERQTEFVAHCISVILSLYSMKSQPPKSVPILAHSMGGIVAKGLFTVPWFDPDSVHLIITMATPHLQPILPFDWMMVDFYDEISKVWKTELIQHVVLISIYGDHKDFQVPSRISRVESNNSINSACVDIPRVWSSPDHQEIVWCRRMVLSLIRTLFELQDQKGVELLFDVDIVKKKFCGRLLNPCLMTPRGPTVDLSKKHLMYSAASSFNRGFSPGQPNYLTIKASSFHGNKIAIVTRSKYVYNSKWVYSCNKGFECRDLSPQNLLLPPTYEATTKLIIIESGDIPEMNITVALPPVGRKSFLSIEQLQIVEAVVLSSILLSGTVDIVTESTIILIPITPPQYGDLVYQIDIATSCLQQESRKMDMLITGFYPSGIFKISNLTRLFGNQTLFGGASCLSYSTSKEVYHNRSLLVVLPAPACRLHVHFSLDISGSFFEFVLNNGITLLELLLTKTLVKLLLGVPNGEHPSLEIVLTVCLCYLIPFPTIGMTQLLGILYLLSSYLHKVIILATNGLKWVIRKFSKVESPILVLPVLVAIVPISFFCGGVSLFISSMVNFLLLSHLVSNYTTNHLAAVLLNASLSIPSVVIWIKELIANNFIPSPLRPDVHSTGSLLMGLISIARAIQLKTKHTAEEFCEIDRKEDFLSRDTIDVSYRAQPWSSLPRWLNNNLQTIMTSALEIVIVCYLFIFVKCYTFSQHLLTLFCFSLRWT